MCVCDTNSYPVDVLMDFGLTKIKFRKNSYHKHTHTHIDIDTHTHTFTRYLYRTAPPRSRGETST